MKAMMGDVMESSCLPKKHERPEDCRMTVYGVSPKRIFLQFASSSNNLAVDLGEVFEIARESLGNTIRRSGIQRYYQALSLAGWSVIGFISLVLYRSFFHRKGTALVNETGGGVRSSKRQIGKALLEHAFSVAKEARHG